jgi:AcrR family transcriptional regulator
MTQRRRTQAERIAISDDALFKAAISIIAQEGPNKMTLANVGKTAGYTGGLVSHRFGSKIGLLKAVSERIVTLWTDRVLDSPRIKRHSGMDGLKMLADEYLNNLKKGSELMMAMHRLMNASYGNCPELRPYFQDYDQTLRLKLAEELKENEELPPGFDAGAFAILYMASLRGIAQQFFISQGKFNLKAAKAAVWKMCDDALRP